MTGRVLKLSRQHYYRWLANPIPDAEITEAYLANSLLDTHLDDPEFGYRYIADEATTEGQPVAVRSAWRLCSENSWYCELDQGPGKNGKRPGPPVHVDLCAIKGAFSGRIVGYSTSSPMKTRLAVDPLEMAVAQRGDVTGCVVHSDLD